MMMLFPAPVLLCRPTCDFYGYGDFLNFNPHLHAIVSDGSFLKDGSFQTASVFMLEDLGEAFQYKVLKMLKKEGKINDTIIP